MTKPSKAAKRIASLYAEHDRKFNECYARHLEASVRSLECDVRERTKAIADIRAQIASLRA